VCEVVRLHGVEYVTFGHIGDEVTLGVMLAEAPLPLDSTLNEEPAAFAVVSVLLSDHGVS
jgi:hypothetical protein